MLNLIIYESFHIDAFYFVILFVTGGRRDPICLEKVLQFVTGCDEEPPLGFNIHPSIVFVESESFLPSASTCTNQLSLPRGSLARALPDRDKLFKLHDYAFANVYFGNI